MSPSTTLNPCRTMRKALERLARGERGCLWLAYVRLHVRRCRRCQQALDALLRYFDRVRDVPEVPTLDWDRMSAGFDEVDREHRLGSKPPNRSP